MWMLRESLQESIRWFSLNLICSPEYIMYSTVAIDAVL